MSADRPSLEAQTDQAAIEVFAMPEATSMLEALTDEQLKSTEAAANAVVEAIAKCMASVITAPDRRSAINELKYDAMAAIATTKVVAAEKARRRAG